MDPVGAPLATDLHSPTHQRQSILGSFLRVRPRGTSQSHQASPNFQLDHANSTNADPSLSDHSVAVGSRVAGAPPGAAPGAGAGAGAGDPPAQPPSPIPIGASGQGHRRRPAAAGGGIQPSISAASHGFNIVPSSTSGVSVHGLSQMLRRRRSANGALNSNSANANVDVHAHTPPAGAGPGVNGRSVTTPASEQANPNPNARTHRIRLVPHLDSTRSLHFEPICRDVREGDPALRIGRFTDRSGMGVAALNAQNTNKLAFKSKVVSRAHAEVWCEPGGKFFIKDTKSSSGTFLNHIRLSAPNTDSKPFPIKDGDVLQLGVDYQGGTEEIYKCVKMRIELGREWQSQPNAFNTAALKQLKALSAQPSSQPGVPTKAGANAGGSPSKSGIADCCICLFAVTVHQSLFIAPCSHVFHYKCIRPMLLMHHPGFSCPLCRTFANLEEDVEIDLDDGIEAADVDSGTDAAAGAGSSGEGHPNPVPNSASTNVSTRDRDAMDVDGPGHGNGNGVETEVERDFAPPNLRRRNNTVTPGASNNASPGVNENTLRSLYQLAPAHGQTGHGGQFEGVPEDADEYISATSDDLHDQHDHEQFHSQSSQEAINDLGDQTHSLPSPSGEGGEGFPTVLGASPSTSAERSGNIMASMSAPSQMHGGYSIQRPMSVPISSSSISVSNNHPSQFRRMALDEGSEGDADGEYDLPIGRSIGAARVGMTMGGDGNASGSSGEGGMGPLSEMGIGEKRKR